MMDMILICDAVRTESDDSSFHMSREEIIAQMVRTQSSWLSSMFIHHV